MVVEMLNNTPREPAEQEWITLIWIAKEMGMSVEEVSAFLKDQKVKSK